MATLLGAHRRVFHASFSVEDTTPNTQTFFSLRRSYIYLVRDLRQVMSTFLRHIGVRRRRVSETSLKIGRIEL